MGTAGPKSHSVLACCRISSARGKRRWNSKGSAASKQESHPLPLSPVTPELLAVVPGVTAQIWLSLSPVLKLVLPWLLASPQGKAAEFQESLSGCELSLSVAGGEQMGCQKIRIPVWTPTCSCHHVTGSLAKAFSLPAPKTPLPSESWLPPLLLGVF